MVIIVAFSFIVSAAPALQINATVIPDDNQTDIVDFDIVTESEPKVLCTASICHSFGGEGTQYEIFKINANNRIKILEPQHIIEWWLRSLSRTNDKSYCIVHSTGDAGYAPTSRDYIGVSFGFCV